MVSYYDLVLGLIPLAFLGVTGSLHLGGVSVTTAVLPAGAIGLALIVHALFVRTPVSHDARSETGFRPAD